MPERTEKASEVKPISIDLLFDLGAHGAFGNVEIVTGLEIDPELRRCSEM